MLAFCTLAGFAQAKKPAGTPPPKKKSEIEGFRDINWGTHKDSVVRDGQKITLAKSQDVNDTNAFTIPGEDMMVGTVMLQSINYMFDGSNRFSRLIMKGNSKDLGAMKYIINNKLSAPDVKEVSGGFQYLWVTDDVRIYLTDYRDQGFFTVEFVSDYQLAAQRKINQNVKDF